MRLRRGEWGRRLTCCPAPGGFVVPEKAATAHWAPAWGGGRLRVPRSSIPSTESSWGPWQGPRTGDADRGGAVPTRTPGAEGSGPGSLSWGCGEDEPRIPGAAWACSSPPGPRTGSGSGGSSGEGGGDVGAGSSGQPPPGLGTALDGDSGQEPSLASEAMVAGSWGPRVARSSFAVLGGRTRPTLGQPLPGVFPVLWGAGLRPPALCFSTPGASFRGKQGSALPPQGRWA